MSFGSTSIDPGSSATVPVARDTIATIVYQRIKKADPTEDSTSPIGNDANPEKVKPVRRGTSDYDSGRVAVGNGAPASVTASTIYPEAGVACNTAAATRKLTITNDADATLIVMTLAPETTVPLPVPKSGSWAGFKAGADGTGVVIQVAGRQ